MISIKMFNILKSKYKIFVEVIVMFGDICYINFTKTRSAYISSGPLYSIDNCKIYL